jgi:hypothetical protein
MKEERFSRTSSSREERPYETMRRNRQIVGVGEMRQAKRRQWHVIFSGSIISICEKSSA